MKQEKGLAFPHHYRVNGYTVCPLDKTMRCCFKHKAPQPLSLLQSRSQIIPINYERVQLEVYSAK